MLGTLVVTRPLQTGVVAWVGDAITHPECEDDRSHRIRSRRMARHLSAPKLPATADPPSFASEITPPLFYSVSSIVPPGRTPEIPEMDAFDVCSRSGTLRFTSR